MVILLHNSLGFRTFLISVSDQSASYKKELCEYHFGHSLVLSDQWRITYDIMYCLLVARDLLVNFLLNNPILKIFY